MQYLYVHCITNWATFYFNCWKTICKCCELLNRFITIHIYSRHIVLLFKKIHTWYNDPQLINHRIFLFLLHISHNYLSFSSLNTKPFSKKRSLSYLRINASDHAGTSFAAYQSHVMYQIKQPSEWLAKEPTLSTRLKCLSSRNLVHQSTTEWP